jgi:hypothetical protein
MTLSTTTTDSDRPATRDARALHDELAYLENQIRRGKRYINDQLQAISELKGRRFDTAMAEHILGALCHALSAYERERSTLLDQLRISGDG